MSYFPRQLTAQLNLLTATFPVVILSGARQVGKSTLLRNVFPGWTSVTFDPVADVGNARQDPDLFLRNHPAPLILDEIQYAPELVPAIKRLVDQDKRPGMYILTGSQQWAVMKTANESLAGRAVFLEMEGFSLAELAQTESSWLDRYLADPEGFVSRPCPRLPQTRTLYEHLFRGGLPDATQVPLEALGRFHQSYIATYVERDVRMLAEIEDRQLYGRFIQLMAALTAQEITFSQLGRELGIAGKTAQRWLQILRDTFQWQEVPPYDGNAIKRVSGKSKGYFADTGLACFLQRISGPLALAGHPMAGALFETAVAAEIRKQCHGLGIPPRIHHWRTAGGSEVDLLLERDGHFFPIEVKMASHPSKDDARGIRAFREAHRHLKVAPGLVIAPVDAMLRLTKDDVAMPWDAA